LNIVGQWSSKWSKYLYLNIRSCRDKAEDPDRDCESQKEIDSKVSAIAIDIYYKTYYHNFAEFKDSPIKTNIEYLFKPLHVDVG
jgi:hypothetical protein